MKKNLILSAVVTSIIMVGCGSSNNSNSNDDNDSNTTARFTITEVGGEKIRVDAQTKLEWIGSSGKNSNACIPQPAATTEPEDIADAIAHCEALEFAGKTDWRVATTSEHVVFIKGMHDAKLTPFYQNAMCPRVIGVDGTLASAVNTHNSSAVGEQTPWSTLLTNSTTNYGVKCVRNF